MKPANCQLLRLGLSLGLMLLFTPLAANSARQDSLPSHAQAEYGGSDTEKTPLAYLTLDIDGGGSAKVMFDFESSLEQKYNLGKVLSTVLGCPLEDIQLSPDDERETTLLYAWCDLPLHRSLFARTGMIDLQPIKDIQNVEPDVTLVLTLSIPQHDFVRCDPVPEQLRRNPVSATCLYFSKDPAHTPATLRFKFGYSRAHGACLGGILAQLSQLGASEPVKCLGISGGY